MLRKWVHRICERLDVVALYSTAAGIKCVNRPVFYERLDYLAAPEIRLLVPEQLRLGFDGLKDTFSLLDTPLTESPHFDLMKRLNDGTDLRGSDYVRRIESGALDFRPPRRLRDKQLAARRADFLEMRARIEAGDYEPITVFSLDGRHYIADGKHRAAVCALLGAGVRCRDASAGLHDSFYWWVLRKMEKTAEQYRKHIRWFGAAAARPQPARSTA